MRHLKLSLFLEGVFYDDNGVETERVTLDANGDLRMINVERDRWHSLVCLEEGAVLFESKDGGVGRWGRMR